MSEFELNGVRIALPEALSTDTIRKKLASGQYEGTEARAVMMRVKRGMRVLELGAGLGYIGALAAQLTEAANVTSVEANPELLKVIRANHERNDASEIDLRHGAVVGHGFDGDTLAFARTRHFWSAHIAEQGDDDDRMTEVPALTISTLFKEVKPQVVIMDIEGAEQFLFERDWPKCVRFVIMELHPKRYESRAVIQKMIDRLSLSGLTYDPAASRGTVLALRRV